MVDSDRGITNLHVPSDVIIDASMPAMIRTSGQMWNAAGDQQDAKAVIPDSLVRGAVRRDDRLLPRARRVRPGDDGHDAERRPDGAEGRGVRLATTRRSRSRPTGTVRVVDIVRRRRCSSTTSRPATSGARARPRTRRCATGCGSRSSARGRPASPAVFWLDELARARRRGAQEGARVPGRPRHRRACRSRSCPCARRRGSRSSAPRAARTRSRVTGNVLRDYLTDLFPILELGTSAKMLSIVPLMNGGGLFETGAGGSAPKHVQQLVSENHLRWDSLGEFLALAVVAREARATRPTTRARRSWAGRSTRRRASCSRTASRRRASVNELDNRGSHFYLALYWAQALRGRPRARRGVQAARRAPGGRRGEDRG